MRDEEKEKTISPPTQARLREARLALGDGNEYDTDSMYSEHGKSTAPQFSISYKTVLCLKASSDFRFYRLRQGFRL